MTPNGYFERKKPPTMLFWLKNIVKILTVLVLFVCTFETYDPEYESQT